MKKINDLVYILIIALLIGLIFYNNNQYRNNLKTTIRQATAKDTIINRYRDTLGRERVTAKARVFSLAQLAESQNEDVIKLRKEVKRLKDFRARVVIRQVTKDSIVTVVNDSLVYDTVFIDGIILDTVYRVQNFNYSDKWLEFTGSIKNDSLRASYAVNNNTTVTHYWERVNGRFKPKSLLLHIESDNPNTSTDRVQTFILEQPKKKWYNNPAITFMSGLAGGFLVGYIIPKQ